MKVIFIEKNDIHCTLTTYLYCAFHMMRTARLMGSTPYISWPQGKFLESYYDKEMFSKIPNAYEWYFKQPFIENPGERSWYEVWTWELPKWGANIHDNYTSQGLMNQSLDVIKDFYKKYLQFNSATDERGDILVQKYNIDFEKTIGISWRGTDIYLDGRPRIPIETYFPFIDNILTNNPDFRIMCTAEETGILDPLLKRYPQAFVIEEFISAPFNSKHNPERFSKVSGYERGLQPALMVWLFSKCKYYIKNRSSTGAVASWLSTGNIISLGHPETLGYDPPGDYYEINGERFTPLYK